MKLSPADIEFLTKETGLSGEKLTKLTEEPGDIELLIESISNRSFNKEELLNISFSIYTKLLIYKYSLNTTFSKEEKDYIVRCIVENYPKLKCGIDLKLLLNKRNSEKLSQYFLVAAGMFKQYVNTVIPSQYIEKISTGFKNVQQKEIKDLHLHVVQWVEILTNMVAGGWFTATLNKKELQKA